MRRGFTLVEVLVAIFIIAILIALLLPAVQAARRAVKRAQCASHLRQLGLAAHNYANLHREMLPGFRTDHDFGWRYSLLPFLEGQTLFDAASPTVPKDSPVLLTVIRSIQPKYQCPATDGYPRSLDHPTSTSLSGGAADYYALHSYNLDPGGHQGWVSGIWSGTSEAIYPRQIHGNVPYPHWLPWPARLAHVTDGLAHTIAVYEAAGRGSVQITGGLNLGNTIPYLPWPYANDWTTTLPDSATVAAQPAFAFNRNNFTSMFSFHGGGVNTLFGDGSVHFLAESTDPDMIRALASREGGEAVSVP